MNIVKQIEQIAVAQFLAVLKASSGDNGGFRMLILVKVGDTVKPFGMY